MLYTKHVQGKWPLKVFKGYFQRIFQFFVEDIGRATYAHRP